MRRRHSRSFGRSNWKFVAGLTATCAAVALGTAVATQGLEGMMKRVSLAFKAMDNPAQLSAEEKAEVKKLIKDKKSAKEMYDKMSPEERERAKQQFNTLSEEQKQKYRELMGK